MVNGASGLLPNPALVPPVELPESTKNIFPVVTLSFATVKTPPGVCRTNKGDFAIMLL